MPDDNDTDQSADAGLDGGYGGGAGNGGDGAWSGDGGDGGAGQGDQAQQEWCDEPQTYNNPQPDYAQQYMEDITPVQKLSEETSTEFGMSHTRVGWLSPDGTETNTYSGGSQFIYHPDGSETEFLEHDADGQRSRTDYGPNPYWGGEDPELSNRFRPGDMSVEDY